MNGREIDKLERYFEKAGKEEIKRGIKTEFFSMNSVEMSGVILTECLLDGLGNTEMAFCGSKNRSGGFGLMVEKRHVEVIIS